MLIPTLYLLVAGCFQFHEPPALLWRAYRPSELQRQKVIRRRGLINSQFCRWNASLTVGPLKAF